MVAIKVGSMTSAFVKDCMVVLFKIKDIVYMNWLLNPCGWLEIRK